MAKRAILAAGALERPIAFRECDPALTSGAATAVAILNERDTAADTRSGTCGQSCALR